MRILLTTDAMGGVWDYATTLYRRFIEAGHEVLLASIGHPQPDRMTTLPPGARWTSRSFQLEWQDGGLEDVEPAARWIARLADAMDADVVHLNQLAYAHRVARPTLVVVHSDAWSWFTEVRGGPPKGDARWAAYRNAVTRSLAAADLVVAPSRYQAELTVRNYGRRVDRVVLNGIDQEHRPDHPSARRPGHRPASLVTVGRAWDPAKGHRVVEEALGRTEDHWTGYLAGELEGPEGQRFQPTRLRHLGRLPLQGVRQLLTRSSVYVAPSLYEPFGLAPVEAAMAGCALVLSDIGSFRELWQDDALYFPPGDAPALARVLDQLREEPGLHHDLGMRARRRARLRYDDRQMATRYLRTYASLLLEHARLQAPAMSASTAVEHGVAS